MVFIPRNWPSVPSDHSVPMYVWHRVSPFVLRWTLGCSYALATGSKCAVPPGCSGLFEVKIASLKHTPRSRVAGSHARLCLVFWGTCKPLYIVAAPVCSATNRARGSASLSSSLTRVLSCPSCVGGCLAVVLMCTSSMISDTEQVFTDVLDIYMSPWWQKTSVWIFCPFCEKTTQSF